MPASALAPLTPSPPPPPPSCSPQIHHPGASCPNRPAPCGEAQLDWPGPNPQLLIGALTAGPAGCLHEFRECAEGSTARFDNTYTDNRYDYQSNEGANGTKERGGGKEEGMAAWHAVAVVAAAAASPTSHPTTHCCAGALDYNSGFVGALAGMMAVSRA